MNKLFTLIPICLIPLIFAFQPHISQAAVRYVDIDATGTNDGSSWANAYTDLQTALQAARTNPAITELWVAEGTYKPTNGTDRNISFSLVDGLIMYGGFIGNETMLSQRDLGIRKSKLSGDIGIVSFKNDNSLHVVKADGIEDEDTLLDGFHIINGFANGSLTDGMGAGIFIQSKGVGVANRVHIKNCRIYNNEATFGGGLANYATDQALSKPVIDFNQIYLNTAVRGGGVFNFKGTGSDMDAAYYNNIFYQNAVTERGAGMYNNGDSGQSAPPMGFNVTVLNGVFYDNTANRGGGIATQDLNASFKVLARNCTFYNNITGGGDAVYLHLNGLIELSNSILWEGAEFIRDQNFISGVTNTNNLIEPGNGSITDPGFANAATRNFRLEACSDAINQGVNFGLITPLDADGNGRQYQGQTDLGAYEFNGLKIALPIPDQVSMSVIADEEITDPDGWTHYYSCAQNKLLFSIFKNGQDIGTLGNNGFEVRISTTADIGMGGTDLSGADYLGSPNTWYAINRSWKITNANPITSPVKVRFPFNQQDVNDLNINLQAESSPLMNNFTRLRVFVVSGTDVYNENVIGSGGTFSPYNNTGVVGASTFLVSSNYNNQPFAEFELGNLSVEGSIGVEGELAPLPIELTSFTAVRDGNRILLDWKTASEVNNDYFMIEKSPDASSFYPMAYQAAAGGLNRVAYYQAVDDAPFRGANYYRLKQVDFDGQYSYSKIVVAYLSNDQDDPKVYPNPALHELRVQLPELVEGEVQMEIWDVLRRVVKQETFAAANQSVLSMPLDGLLPGNYVLKITGKRYRAYHQFVKMDLD